jgi:signal transduction histidine kinase
VTRRLLLSYLAVTAIALAFLAVPLGVTIGHREKERLLYNIERDADAMAAVAGGPVGDPHNVSRLEIIQYAARTGSHVVVVDARGRARLDTDRPDDPGRDYSTNRPEIQAALHGRRVEGTRSSETLRTTLVYAAVPVTENGRVSGAVRITYPTATLDRRVHKTWFQLALLCAGVLFVAAAVGFVLARSLTRPLRDLERAADELAEGDLDARVSTDSGPPDLRRLAETFNRMADRLAGLVEAQQSFVADASHQLRTPLTALRLRLENLEASAVPSDRASLDAASEEVARMGRLVDGLLMLARGAGDRDARIGFDAIPVVRGRVEMWAEVSGERDVQVVFEGPDSVAVSAIAGAVEQLVDNLVDNALAVSPRDSTIVVRVEPAAAGRVELHVLDNGPGLDSEERQHAFDRFWRGERAAPGGSGLGLAIVRQLAIACGGSARLDERAGGGTDAVVTLAAAPVAAIMKS